MKPGSEKWLETLGAPHTISHDEQRKFIQKILEGRGDLNHWLPLGIPNPEVIRGTFHVAPDDLDLIRRLTVEVPKGLRPEFRIFPVGIPATDLVRVDFEIRKTHSA